MVRFGWLFRSPARALGLCPALLLLLLAHSPQTMAATAAVANSPLVHSPVLILPADTSVTVCLGESYCYTVRATDADNGDKLTLTLLSGPITFPPFAHKSPLEKLVCFKPGEAGSYRFIWKVTDPAGSSAIDTIVITVAINNPPAIEDQYFSASLCNSGPRQLQLVAKDPDGDPLVWSLTSGAGSLDSKTGILTYTPTSSGAYAFVVKVSSSCGYDVAKVLDSVVINKPPVVQLFQRDTALCSPGQVCVPYTASDPDSPYSLQTNVGQVNPETHTVCFAADTNGTYRIILTATDSCGSRGADTALVTVKIAPTHGSITCPEDTAIFLCAPGNVCLKKIFTTFANLQTSFGAIDQNGQLCFRADSAGTYVFTLTGSDECSADTCRFKVSVGLNHPPVLSVESLPARSWCGAGTVCVPLHYKVNDPDGNVRRVAISFGTLDVNGDWCFRADSAGTYQAVLSVIDSCGAFDKATVTITLIKNRPPQVVIKGFDTTLCSTGTLCLPLSVTDDGAVQVATSFGQLSDNHDRICFTPDSTGRYRFIVTATDECGSKDIDTAFVKVTLGSKGTLSCPGDQRVKLCAPGRVCISGIESSFAHLTASFGEITPNGSLCFSADTAGIYAITIRGSNDCSTESCTFRVTVALNHPPVITEIPDSSGSCNQAIRCVRFTATDGDGDHLTIRSNVGTVEQGSVCFPADTAGLYTIIIIAQDSCGADTLITQVRQKLSTPPVVDLGKDASFALCSSEEVCFPVTVDDPDLDLADVHVSYGSYDALHHRICFVADTAGVYRFILTATDSCGGQDADTALITISLNKPPVVKLTDGIALDTCGVREICVPVSVIDDNLTRVYSNFGNYHNGQVCFTPDTSGLYTLIVTAVDDCNRSVSDTTTIRVRINHPVSVSGLRDTSIFLCRPTEICLPFTLTNPDHALKTLTSNVGRIVDGHVCFVPYDSGRRLVVVTATDSCGTLSADTAIVDIRTDQALANLCPRDTTIFLCQPETLCFPLQQVLPDNVSIKVHGTGVWYDKEKNAVCFYSTCCLQNTITIDYTTPCGKHTCGFTVNLKTNSKPLVILPPDRVAAACDAGQVCIPVGISDANHNLMKVVTNLGSYEKLTNRVCFQADTTGVYRLIVTAIDSCGIPGADTMRVTVRLNVKPTVQIAAPDSVYKLCAAGEICLPVTITDPNANIASITVNGGAHYDAQTKRVCVEVDQGGRYCVTVRVTDSCGAADTATACLTVVRSIPVAIDCPTGSTRAGQQGRQANPDDQSNLKLLPTVSLCASDTVCVPLKISGDTLDVTVSGGFYRDGQVCLFADTTGQYNVRVIARGNCNSDTCSFTVPVVVQPPVHVMCPGDQNILLCSPDTVCYSLKTSGPVDSVRVFGAGYAQGGQVCVPLISAGKHEVTVVAYGLCNTDTCRFTVTARDNRAPFVTGPDSTLSLCELKNICLPISYGDLDGNFKSIFASIGSISRVKRPALRQGIDGEDGSGPAATSGTPEAQLCFTPDHFGTYEIVLTVTDSCDATASIKLTVVVNQSGTVAIQCPGNVTEKLCDAHSYCLTIPVSGAGYVLSTNVGTLDGNRLCLPVDFFGERTFNVRLIGTSDCNTDTCEFTVTLTNFEAPHLTCSTKDTSVFVCNYPSVISVPFGLNAGSVIDSLVITPASAVKRQGQNVIDFTATSNGTTIVTLRAYAPCGADSCSFVIRTTVNQPPTIRAPRDTAVVSCNLDTLCLPFTFADADNNLREITTSLGLIRDNDICFKPTGYGTFTIVLTATDSCGASAKDTVHFTFSSGDTVRITCPNSPIQLTVPVPDTVIVPVTVTPPGANVIVLPAGTGSYNSQTGKLSLFVTQTGQSNYTLIASSACSADTCHLTVDIGQYFPPQVSCVGTLDTTLCLTHPEQLCFPVTVLGTNVTVQVSSGGTYANGKVCVPVDTGGTYVVRVIAANEFEADTCTATLHVRRTTPPNVDLPPTFAVKVCDTGLFCIPVDLHRIPFTLDQIHTNIGYFDSLTSSVCVRIDSAGLYTVIVRVNDSCGNVDADTVQVTVQVNKRPVVVLPSDTSIVLCEQQKICLPVSIQDDGTVDLTTNFGTIANGTLCFNADTSGLYRLIVTATDSCGLRGSDTVKVRVSINHAPTISSFRDTTLYLCRPTTVCLPLSFNDPDAGDIVTVHSSFGSYDPAKGICFVPYDSGHYQVIVTVTDKCGKSATDTAQVTVRTDQSIKLTCPRDTNIFICAPESLCFPIGGIPQGATVKVSGTGVKWNPATQTVCFYSECCLTNTIKVSVTTTCGTVLTCSFTVTVTSNSRPLVILPHDTTVNSCDAAGTLCFPAGISDVDRNIAHIQVSGGTYHALTNTVCLASSAPGLHVIILTATDSCGLSDVDTMNITVQDNRPPTVTLTLPQPEKQCTPVEVCIPVNASDPDGNRLTIIPSIGRYDTVSHSVCILPNGPGQYCVEVVATDPCGAADTASGCITILAGDTVGILCPSQPIQVAPLCKAGTVCVDLAIVGTNYRVVTSFGSYADGRLCFTADSSGTYRITVIASAQCNSDTCVITVPVTIQPPVDITCLPIQQVFFCKPDTVCYTLEVSSSVDSITVPRSVAYVTGRNSFCVPITFTGLRNVKVTAYGKCGTDTCTVQVIGTINTAPLVQLGRDTTLTVCSLSSICVNLTTEDINHNILSIVPNRGTIGGGKLCYTPVKFGIDTLIVTVTDSCGAKAADTAIVTVKQGASAHIGCPSGTQFASICKPDSVCIVVPITPANATVTILPSGKYNPATGTVCIFATQSGTIPVTVIASAPCGADTCHFNLQVTKNDPPNVTSPASLDTLMCLARPDTLCIPVTVTGTGVTVSVTPPAYYSGGSVCLPVSAAGTYQLRIIGSGVCGVDTSITTVHVRKDQLPTVTLPTTGLTFERCPSDTTSICISGISVSDAEGPATLSKLCGPGHLNITGQSASLCFVPDTAGTYAFCIRGFDGCNEVIDTLRVLIEPKPDCDVCVKFSFDWGKCTPVGLRKSVDLKVATNQRIGGFDLLLKFDASALSFVNATIQGTDIQGWEYFTWNLGGSSCGGTCPPGILRLVGIAEINNGALHPPDSTLSPNGRLVQLDFQVKNDQNLGDQFVPISFIWYDCADNSVSDPTGANLLVDRRIYNSSNGLIWDETDDVTYPESSRTFGIGSPDECFNHPGKATATRCIDFVNGGICIINPDSIDARGDVNLNGLAFEVADAVLFTNYFIHGLSVFTLSVAGQTAATDVNGDGITLTVADLAYMIRVIVGDANPHPKLDPYATDATVRIERQGSTVTTSASTIGDIGAAWLVYDLSGGASVSQVELSPAAGQMDLKWAIDGNQLRVLVFDLTTDRIAAGDQELVRIITNGEGTVTLNRADLADYDGRPYTVQKGGVVPDKFVVYPNYPNPFNPSTMLSFSLNSPGDWTITIYDITGAVVRGFSGTSAAGLVEHQWDGTDERGNGVASGVYFYRVQAGEASQTRKMMLLK